MSAVEIFATSPVLVALIVGGFGLLDWKTKRRFERHEQFVTPIVDQVVNDHKDKNLRTQVDRLELKLNNQSDNHTQSMEYMQDIHHKLDKFIAWSETENVRLWQAVTDKKKAS